MSSKENSGGGAIEFGDAGQAAKISYSVPMPVSHTGRRILKLDLGLAETDWSEAAFGSIEDILESEGIVKKDKSGNYEIDEENAFIFWKRRAMKAGVPSRICDLAREAYDADKETTAQSSSYVSGKLAARAAAISSLKVKRPTTAGKTATTKKTSASGRRTTSKTVRRR